MSRLALTAAALVLLGACAALSALPARADLSAPPPPYDHPFHGQVAVSVATRAEVRSACAAYKVNAYTVACSRGVINGVCHVLIIADKELQAMGHTRRAVMRHEIGHCNGWPADHRR